MGNEQWITFCLIMKWMDIFYRQNRKRKKAYFCTSKKVSNRCWEQLKPYRSWKSKLVYRMV